MSLRQVGSLLIVVSRITAKIDLSVVHVKLKTDIVSVYKVA